MLQETCERLIGEAKASVGAAGAVYQILMNTPGVLPAMDAVATAMNMTNRTLRRRLSADDIATLLGFSDSAAFRKALKRWTSKGLGELRGRPR